MPTWKKKEEGELRFRHLCATCNERIADILTREGWLHVRDGEPISCNECALKCLLTATGQWGEADAVRYAVCAGCLELDNCVLKGRYFC